jgi:hypothetical protein
MHRSRSHDAVIRVYDEAGNVSETHERKGANSSHNLWLTLEFFDAYSVVPKASAIAAIGCEIIELHSYGTVGVERNVYVRLKPKAGDTTVGSGGADDQKPNFRADSTGSI